MQLRGYVTLFAVVGLTSTLAIFSCGGNDGDSDGTVTNTATTEGKDVTQPFTLAVTGATIDVPAGAFAAGSKVGAAVATSPAEFTANADTSLATVAVGITGTDAKGAAISQAAVPFTVSLDLSAAAALAAVDKTPANVCVLGKGIDNVLRVWRAAKLTVSAKAVKFPALWLGVYQALYCGENFADLPEVNATGDAAVAAGGAASASGTDSGTASVPVASAVAFTCDATKIAQMNYCTEYVGLIFQDEKFAAPQKTTCTEAQGVLGTSCPTEGAVGQCVFQFGTFTEFAWTYYTATLPEGANAENLKVSCEGLATAKWFAAGTYTPTPAANQTAPGAGDTTGSESGPDTTGDMTCGTVAPSCREKVDFGPCVSMTGEAYKANPQAQCNDDDHTYSTAACPTEGRLGCCKDAKIGDPANGGFVFDYVLYSGGGMNAAGAQAICNAYQATYVPAN